MLIATVAARRPVTSYKPLVASLGYLSIYLSLIAIPRRRVGATGAGPSSSYGQP